MLNLLIRLFGKDFLNKVIGTRTNVVKPIKLDRASPYKLYKDEAFNDPELRQQIEDKLQEYAPLVLSNKNASEVANYEMNARRLLNAKEREFGITDRLKETRTQKPEADVIDIKTGKKAEGIESLKEDLGLPPEVSPKSKMGKNLQELKRLTKETELQKKDIDETMDKGLENIFRTFMQQPSVNTIIEGKRRAVIRKILLKDNRINLPKDVRTSLENYDDLRGGGKPEMDPLNIFDKYYKRDTNKLEVLDSIIDNAENEVKAADEFKFLEDGFELKDVPDDIPDMATGGRVGFFAGGAKGLLKLLQSKLGKDKIKMADEVKVSQDVTDKIEFDKAKREDAFMKQMAPKAYERMQLKIRYPGINDKLIEQILIDDNPQRKAEVLATLDEVFEMMKKGMSADDVLKTFKTTPRTKQAEGGLSYLLRL